MLCSSESQFCSSSINQSPSDLLCRLNSQVDKQSVVDELFFAGLLTTAIEVSKSTRWFEIMKMELPVIIVRMYVLHQVDVTSELSNSCGLRICNIGFVRTRFRSC